MPDRISNIDVAVLMKLNELAARYGLKPTDFEAFYDTDTGNLRFASQAPGDAISVKYEKLEKALGISEKSGDVPVKGGIELYERIESAIDKAPSLRFR